MPNSRLDRRTGRRDPAHATTPTAAVFVSEGTPAFTAWHRAIGPRHVRHDSRRLYRSLVPDGMAMRSAHRLGAG
ncbi:hypothetical protein [Microvirga makkahensis]|uniref:Uncharacterized protein n=1 Tax=Microvirga makkahensis TaxID=1128670 RepID=A0A7X3SR35_9HYPH|nr:hypothetical protein [Microvirga makkahensis]MXQ13955.1 hypothetical protein [Microvirga makkahensis]